MKTKKVIYVDMDDVICDYTASYQEKIKKNPKEKYPQSIERFFLDLKPIEGSVDVVNKLRLVDLFDVYILTSPSIKNPHCYTEKRLWVEKYFDLEMTEKLIITPNKGLNKGDYLIDDYLNGRGQESFEGKLIHFGSNEFKDWLLVLDFFKKKYNNILG